MTTRCANCNRVYDLDKGAACPRCIGPAQLAMETEDVKPKSTGARFALAFLTGRKKPRP